MVHIPWICRVLYIPGGCLGFLPSTVWCMILKFSSMAVTNLLPVATPFQQRTVDESVLKRKSKLWPNSHVLQSFHCTVAVFGTHFFHHFSVSDIRKSPQIVISSAAELLWRNQPIIANNPSKGGANATLHCTGPSAIQNLPIRIFDGCFFFDVFERYVKYCKNTCSSKWAIPFLQFLQPLKIRHLKFQVSTNWESPWPTQRWLILTAHGNGYCHQWQQRQNRQDGQALSSTDRKRTTGETIRGCFESWGLAPPNPVGLPYFKKSIQFKRNKTKQVVFFVLGNPCLWVRHHNYTLENQHGTQKWRFGRWSSFSTGSFVGSKAVHFVCVCVMIR